MKPDYAHLQTEKELAKLEARIARIYTAARDELEETVKAYFESFEKRDAEMKALIGTIQNGKEWTEADYKQWRLNQIGRGKRFEALRDLMAERYTKANEIAIAYVNDETPGIYSLNRNYKAYTIEATGVDVSFTLFNEETIRRLAVEAPDLMPYYPAKKALERGIDLAYGKKQITAAVTSAILQGKSIPQIADDLQSRIQNMDRVSAIRTARTAISQAQNGGDYDSVLAAAKMGIKYDRKWRCQFDNRTRHFHGLADGQIAEFGEPFIVGGEKMMFPTDTSMGASGWNIYNCRCEAREIEKPGIEAEPRQYRVKNPATGRYELINEMSYEDWKAMKKAQNPEEFEKYMKMGKNMSSDKSMYRKYKAVLGDSGPQRFSEFQDVKYNHPDEYEELKKRFRKENKYGG